MIDDHEGLLSEEEDLRRRERIRGVVTETESAKTERERRAKQRRDKSPQPLTTLTTPAILADLMDD